jgi:competence protein ComFC
MLFSVCATLEKFFFPRHCIHCGLAGRHICKVCEKIYLKPYSVHVCHVCATPTTNEQYVHDGCRHKTSLDGVLVCFHYSVVTRKLLSLIKYQYFYAYIDVVVDCILKVFRISFLQNALLVPVPLHRYKRWKRGFNQADLLAKGLAQKAKRVGVSVESKSILKRTKNTKTQVGMSKYERIQNLKGVFAVRKLTSEAMDKKVILVDDVMTSGTTLEECACVLKDAGIKEVYALVFARG